MLSPSRWYRKCARRFRQRVEGDGSGVPQIDAKDRDILIVHTSDVHVDHEYTARTNGGDGAAPLARVLDAARALDADMVLLCGDTFDCHKIPLDLVARVGNLVREAGIPVSLCGDMASEPKHLAALLEAGLTSLSVAPARIARLKAAIAEL